MVIIFTKRNKVRFEMFYTGLFKNIRIKKKQTMSKRLGNFLGKEILRLSNEKINKHWLNKKTDRSLNGDHNYKKSKKEKIFTLLQSVNQILISEKLWKNRQSRNYNKLEETENLKLRCVSNFQTITSQVKKSRRLKKWLSRKKTNSQQTKEKPKLRNDTLIGNSFYYCRRYGHKSAE